MKVINSFFKQVPIEKKDIVLKKIRDFEKVLLQSKALNKIQKGYWIRKIEGTDIYKFRVNSGHRILFKYKKINNENEILFIEYCNHDQQIRKGRNYSGNKAIIDFEIDKSTYEEKEIDKDIDNYVKDEIYLRLNEIEDSIIEDEYIALAISEESDERFNFLSLEQSKCIKSIDKPILIIGCAGSGKTILAVRKLMLNNSLKIKTAYVTCSKSIMNEAKFIYNNLIDNDSSTYFYTFQDICCEIIGLKDPKIIKYNEFYNWMIENHILDKENININIRDVWIEINTFIKGVIIDQDIKSMLDKNEYLDYKESSYDTNDKSSIYNIVVKYQKWLNCNQYYDENDLATNALNKVASKFEYIIYDEIQELTDKQLMLISNLTSKTNNIMLLGDINQNININRIDLSFIKRMFSRDELILNESIIMKNYRNSICTIEWINKFNEIKNSKFKSVAEKYKGKESGIKKGIKPRIIYSIDEENEFFSIINEDLNSIVIVADDDEKNILKSKGYELGRIFTVEEARGLEYKNIYCYNLICKYKKIWDKLTLKDFKYDDKLKAYFNIIYIAVTRAKDKVFFIERENTNLNPYLDKYWDIIYKSEELITNITRSIDRDEWIKEAKKLERKEKYFQAAEAYKRVGLIEEYKLCLEASERKIKYDNFNNFTINIIIEAKNLNNNNITRALNKLVKSYDIEIKGFLEIVTFNKEIDQINYINKYVNNIEIDKVSLMILEEINKENIDNKKVIIRTCLYKEDLAINEKEIFKKDEQAILISINDTSVVINECDSTQDIISLQKINEDIESRKIKINTDLEMLKNKSIYESKTSDEILSYIFNK